MTIPTTPLPSRAVLLLLLDYDPATGDLTWKHRPDTFPGCETFNARFPGKPALAAVKAGGYRAGKLLGEYVLAHRVIFKMLHDAEPPQVDHENGVKTDNRPGNLLASDHGANARNRKRSRRNRSGTTGVAEYIDKTGRKWWRAFITVQSKTTHLGLYDATEEGKARAIAARKDAERRHGYHPNHGLTSAERATRRRTPIEALTIA